jgi:hypothetical protein
LTLFPAFQEIYSGCCTTPSANSLFVNKSMDDPFLSVVRLVVSSR